MNLRSLLDWRRGPADCLLQIDAKAITPSEFRSRMLSAGVILLRGAVSDEIILPIADEIERMMDHFDGIPAEVLQREMESEDAYRRSILLQILKSGVHYNYDLVVFSRGRHSLYDPIRKSLLGQAGLRNSTGYSDMPLTAHVDAMFHGHDRLGINFWLPLTTAGKERPGLALVPMGVEETKIYLEYNAEGYEPREPDFASMNHFRTEKLELESWREAGMTFVKPHMNPGDALAFTNFTIYATYIHEAMTHPRTSIEGRMLVEPPS